MPGMMAPHFPELHCEISEPTTGSYVVPVQQKQKRNISYW